MIQSSPPEEEKLASEDHLDAEGAGRGERVRRRILRSTALLPVLLTLANGLCGFASIHFATKHAAAALGMTYLVYAAWFIVAAMVCDMLDGQVARIARRTSDFGAQLDSMCDVVSFGVAPAVLMLRTVIPSLPGQMSYVSIERVVWGIAAAYLACAVLRLARFNVEHESTDTHFEFSGLPSPAAAGTIAALVLLANDLSDRAWASPERLAWGLSLGLSAVAVTAALLMVSQIRYPHLVNLYIRGRRPFNYIVRLVLVGVAALFELYLTGALVALLFLLSGPLRTVWKRMRTRAASTSTPRPSA
ncbi:MAG TPA: CDP-diacylglycerol--serine O-phosphatidyltransferase [Phycisphaerae bacterium]|nr:CDP-diacylglycerol--serine O-phosphatidyltransferase [Phycisphaerae bacterium]